MDSQPGNGVAQVRVSDAERDAIVTRLNDATSEGRLTLEEFSERVSQALVARTRGDLDVVVQDLPETAVGRVATSAVDGAGGSHRSRWVRSNAVAGGGWTGIPRWRPFGSIKLDMRNAEITASEIHLHVESVVGSVKVWVPYGIAVEVDGHSVLGSRSVAEDTPRPGAPVLRLRVDTVLGSVKVYRV